MKTTSHLKLSEDDQPPEGEEVRVSDAADIGCPPVARLVSRDVENAHLQQIAQSVSLSVCHL